MAITMDKNPEKPRRLPAKVLEKIICEMADKPLELRCLARVSRSFQPIAEKQLYASVDISSVEQMATFVQALEKRPARRAYVRTCRIQSTPGGEDTDEAREWLSCNVYANIAALENLEDLSITSDALLESAQTCCDGQPQEEQDVLEAFLFKASLAITPPELRTWPHLTSIELHYLAAAALPSTTSFLFPSTKRWAFPDPSFLFLSPTLRHITIHDAIFSDTCGAALLCWSTAAATHSSHTSTPSDYDEEAPPPPSPSSDPTSDRIPPPRLRSSTASTTTPPTPTASLNPSYTHTTPLQSLRLLNTSITLRALRTLLSAPRALRHLSIAEGPGSRARGLDALGTSLLEIKI
ncbi:Peptidase S8/S53 subtilisin/kexin/sedolisin [Macrophomina phaseolina MS6]|uniref:Peptidase S8/S53 subtilisin/kexin/sedolisin n=1 Tax=Macrophomina phaseolina (strain MS6) TaxID=1126212 RepID=K2SK06_MACPH|nr:Peptidase S8/S53 subtilisin/kexin/sedolisin [Macrophomina phaseolina MS6]